MFAARTGHACLAQDSRKRTFSQGRRGPLAELECGFWRVCRRLKLPCFWSVCRCQRTLAPLVALRRLPHPPAPKAEPSCRAGGWERQASRVPHWRPGHAGAAGHNSPAENIGRQSTATRRAVRPRSVCWPICRCQRALAVFTAPQEASPPTRPQRRDGQAAELYRSRSAVVKYYQGGVDFQGPSADRPGRLGHAARFAAIAV